MSRIDDYLDELASRLRGTPSETRRLLTEVEAHLLDAADAAVADGMSRDEAERCAIERFGDPGTVARAANGSVAELVGSLVRATAWLSVAGFSAILAGALLARLAAALTSVQAVFGLPAGVRPPSDAIAHWLAVQPTAADWRQAAALENADDTLLLRGGAALIGLVVAILVLALARRRFRPLGGGSVQAIGMTAFGGAGIALLAAAVTGSYSVADWGRGQLFCDAAAALTVALAYVIGFLRTLRTA